MVPALTPMCAQALLIHNTFFMKDLIHGLYNHKVIKSKITCFTFNPSKSTFTCTLISIFHVYAGTTIFTWITFAFIDVYK